MRQHSFKPESRLVRGHHKRVQVARCGRCPTTHEFNVNTETRGGMSSDTIIRKLTLLGWESMRGGRDLECPACVKSLKVLTTFARLDDDPSLIRDLMTSELGREPTDEEAERSLDILRVQCVLQEGAGSLDSLRQATRESGFTEAASTATFTPKEKRTKPMGEAAPPRELKREEKRAILEALSVRYVGEEVGYAEDWSDAKVAAHLSVPEKFVRDLRIDIHGENGGNEFGSKAERERKKALNEIRTDIHRAEGKLADAFAAMATAETTLQNAKARLVKLESGS